MSDFIAVLLIAYVQFGLLLAWYLFYRRVLAAREDFAAEQAGREILLRDLGNEVASLRQQLRDLNGNRPRRSFHGESQVLQQAKRRGVLEMARREMDAHHIAETLNLRRAEVETLVRLDRLQRAAEPQTFEAQNWLETAS
jgi:hypothetical protein